MTIYYIPDKGVLSIQTFKSDDGFYHISPASGKPALCGAKVSAWYQNPGRGVSKALMCPECMQRNEAK